MSDRVPRRISSYIRKRRWTGYYYDGKEGQIQEKEL